PQENEAGALGRGGRRLLSRGEMLLCAVRVELREPRTGRLPVKPRDSLARVRRLDRQLERCDGARGVAPGGAELTDALPELGRQLGLARLPGAYLLVETLRFRARLVSELLSQMLVLAHCVCPAPRERVQAHQADVSFLEQRIGRDQHVHGPGRA